LAPRENIWDLRSLLNSFSAHHYLQAKIVGGRSTP
jgi:hypothetical protein